MRAVAMAVSCQLAQDLNEALKEGSEPEPESSVEFMNRVESAEPMESIIRAEILVETRLPSSLAVWTTLSAVIGTGFPDSSA